MSSALTSILPTDPLTPCHSWTPSPHSWISEAWARLSPDPLAGETVLNLCLSQSHSAAVVGRDLWRPPRPIPRSSQVSRTRLLRTWLVRQFVSPAQDLHLWEWDHPLAVSRELTTTREDPGARPGLQPHREWSYCAWDTRRKVKNNHS